MVASAVFITDTKGKAIIARNYRGDIPMSVVDRFSLHIQEKDEVDLRPVFTEDGITYVYVKCNNLLLMAATKKNSNVTLILFYLYKLTTVFKDYFGELEEESIRDNFVVVYELLDETMDFGYPQTCESKILREVVTQESNRLESAPRPPIALTNAVSWRSEGIKHRKNEIFLDVIEKLNILVASNGTVLHSEIIGSIQMKSFLSGMPELKLGLNDKLMFEATGRATNKIKAVELEDIKFHQCVRLAQSSTISSSAIQTPYFALDTTRMSTPALQAAPAGDSAPLLAQGSEQQSDPQTTGSHDVEQASRSGEEPERQVESRWSWLAWLRGSRPGAQRLPSEEAEDASELQERGGQPPSIAVVVEAADGGSDGPSEAASSGSSNGRGAGGREAEQGASASSNAEIEPRQSGSPRMARLPSRGQPTCLICLEEFRQEEFINGSALRLECNCRGDLALRHRDCVMKWVQVKGSNVCELCKAEIRNIPAPPPRPAEADLPALDEAYFNDPNHIHDFMPSSQDLVFDCIRVCWVAMIVSILFFEMSLGAALWTGMLAGLAYSIMVRLMYRQHFFAMRRLAEQQAAARREQEAASGGEAPVAAPAGAPPVVVAV